MTREPTAARGRRGSFRGKNPVRGGRRFTNPQYYKGGTAEDPLNLSNVGLEDDEPEEVVDEVVEIFVPKNPRDPLNLNASSKRKYEKNGDESLSPCKKVSKVGEPEPETSTATDDDANKKKDKKEYFNRKYHYGNFDKYYGVRLGAGEKDPRISSFKKEWFEKKSVLDIGCNVGFLTLSIAKEFGPRRILGIDIDEHLVGVARKNIRHYCDAGVEFTGKFPASFAKQLGPISGHTLSFSSKFPDNTWFRRENYVLSSDEELELVEPEFDVILALSITKWIHLNFGDDGMRRFFLRAFRQLLPGGRFILEPQPFDSYRKRAKMLPELMTNYKKTEFKPQDFETYLLETVGFRRVEHVGAPCAKTKGFERPIDVYVKPMPGSSRPTPSSSSAVASPATDTGSSATDVETVATPSSSSTAASPASAP